MGGRKPATADRVTAGPDPVPREYRPQLATLVKSPPAGREWIHEIKYDGYRIGCRIDRGTVTLLSRNGKDWTGRFPEIRADAATLRVRRALLDGEVAVLVAEGRTSFQALQNAFSGGSRKGLVYLVFDLIHLDGQDLSAAPLETRKAMLSRLVGPTGAHGRIRYSEHVDADGVAVWREACRLGLEGIISKRRDLAYHPGRQADWLKTKCISRQEFVIGGFTDPKGTRAGIGALLVGCYDSQKRLRFAGKVGTGFTTTSARELRGRLEALEQNTCPFEPRPPGSLGRRAHWVRPELVGEIAYTEWTADGRIRHPSFQGLREDKRPEDIALERAVSSVEAASAPEPSIAENHSQPASGESTRSASRAAARKSGRIPVAGVGISNPGRVLYPDIGLTKIELARFYEAHGEWLLPQLRGRPLTLVRCPKGLAEGCFYMKHSQVWAPAALRRIRIQEKTKIGEYLIADTVAAVVSLVQMDVLEMHTWNSTEDHLEEPDRLVFDVDPGPEVAWTQVAKAARLVRDLLRALTLESFLKTTGGSGLHVVVPLVPRANWSECLAFSHAVAEAVVRRNPQVYTTAFKKAGRERKILIDYLRNNRTNTSVAAYSTRARPQAPISVPIAWAELSSRLRSDRYTIRTLPRRLARLSEDPWKDYWTVRQEVDARLVERAGSL